MEEFDKPSFQVSNSRRLIQTLKLKFHAFEAFEILDEDAGNHDPFAFVNATSIQNGRGMSSMKIP